MIVNSLRFIPHALVLIGIFSAMCLASDAALPPNAVRAEPAPEWNAKFDGKAGWIGGDGLYSIDLAPDRVLWWFGDSLIGQARDGRRSSAVMVNNAIGIQSGHGPDAAIRFVTGTAANGGQAALILPADGKGWFWPQGVIRVGSRLFVFLPQIVKTRDPGAFGFRQIGQWLAEVDNPQDDPDKWRVQQHNIPAAKFDMDDIRSWGSAVLADGPYIYVYGYLDNKKGFGSKHLALARAPADKLKEFATWQYRTADGWSDSPADAVAQAGGLAAEFSVSRLPNGKGFVLVYTENGLGDRILGRFSNTPQGPWSAPLLLYRCPEMAADKGLFTYAAKAHPWAANGDELIISYCVNSWDFSRLFKDETVYRPRFVRVKMKAPE